MEIMKGLFGEMADSEQRTYKLSLRNLYLFKKRKENKEILSKSHERWEEPRHAQYVQALIESLPLPVHTNENDRTMLKDQRR